MSMHVAPGDTVVKGQTIASNSNLLTEEHSRLGTVPKLVPDLSLKPQVQ